MNPPVTGRFAHVDPNAGALTINDLIDILNPVLSIQINGSYIPYIISNSTPGTEDTDKAWIELDSSNRPVAIRIFYNGRWRRIYNGMLGEVRMYTGNPSDATVWVTSGDKTGLGVIGGIYDGWAICNGNNGTPDLSDQFICGAHMNNKNGHSGYNNGWQTFVDGKNDLKTGGAPNHMVASNELPPINPTDPMGSRSDLVIRGSDEKDTGTGHPDVRAIVTSFYDETTNNQVTIAHYGADPSAVPPDPQVPLPTLPPFFALAFIMFVGY